MLVQRPEVGDAGDEDVADGVELDVADLLGLAGGADDLEGPPPAPVPEVELVVGGDDEELVVDSIDIMGTKLGIKLGQVLGQIHY